MILQIYNSAVHLPLLFPCFTAELQISSCAAISGSTDKLAAKMMEYGKLETVISALYDLD